jgi:Zn-dependent protease with chaperone function
MARASHLYPPSPPNVPRYLTAPSTHYRLQVILVLASLFLFGLLYVGLLAGSAWLVFWAIVYPIGDVNGPRVFLKMGLSGVSVVLFLFLLKALFKRPEQDKVLQVEVVEEEHPEFFAFLRQLCGEIGAPFPHRVYVSPDVNAAVFYHRSVLRLFLPTPKNLVVGLGLVNVLNLTEFKAVLAHEFGHFSQSSMKLGTYVYTANRIIADMVFGRDALDHLLDQLKGSDLRIAVFAWLVVGVLWVLRKILEGIFRVINFANSALSRQMEFHADLVAVSVTGSDALVCGLARLDFASQALGQTLEDLRAAADHQLHTWDLFFHQNHAARYLRDVRQDPQLGEPPPIPEGGEVVQVFEPGEEGIPRMWATHPSNYDRERNAKRCYIRGVVDERSPWLLFTDAAALRERLTRRIYRRVFRVGKDVPLDDAEAVQAFIDEEHAETTYHARYQGLYDDRYLELEYFELVPEEGRFQDEAGRSLADAHAALYGKRLKTWLEGYQQRRKEHNLLVGLEAEALQLAGKSFEFRGRNYRLREAGRLRKKVERELDRDRKWLGDFDRRVLRVHYHMSCSLDPSLSRELLDRYTFHKKVQTILQELTTYQKRLGFVLGELGSKQQLSAAEFSQVLAFFREAYRALEKHLEAADRLSLPVLKNLAAGTPLGSFLLEEPLAYELRESDRTLDGKWIGEFIQQLSTVCDKARRIHFKSLGGILALQEKITANWHARQQAAVTRVPAESPAQRQTRP